MNPEHHERYAAYLTPIAKGAWDRSKYAREGFILLEIYFASKTSDWPRAKVLNPITGKVERFWFDLRHWRRQVRKTKRQ